MRRKLKSTGSNSPGKCALCDFPAPADAMALHLEKCLAGQTIPTRAKLCPLIHVQVEGADDPKYWLHLEVRASSKLSDLDRFLRDIWLECCGHLSAFEIAGIRYVVMKSTFGLGWDIQERSMSVSMAEVLRPRLRIEHEYDYGSTTYLRLRVVGTREGPAGNRVVRLLARNLAPAFRCRLCSEPATQICLFCSYGQQSKFCKKHAKTHRCDEDRSFLPVVNSPRMGVCGYEGGGEG